MRFALMAAIKPSLRRTSEREDFLDAAVRYGGFTQRTVLFRKPGELVITDEVSGPAGVARYRTVLAFRRWR